MNALCAQAGLGIVETRQDEDYQAVDLGLNYPEGVVRVQLKCSSAKTMAGNFETIDLEQSWIDNWKENVGPVFIVLVVVPDQLADWLTNHDLTTVHETHAYWTRYDKTSSRKSVRLNKVDRVDLGTLFEWRNLQRVAYGLEPIGE
ncbi:hypothetical protein CH300_00295 [Rhodococcus sp. 15-1154-1]|nr:hypothetical protein CH300_00295 [Rhodococcus sp. 15-1154-1]